MWGWATARPTRGRIMRMCPFRPLRKPLAQSRVALITTASPYQPGKGEQGPGAPYNAAAKFYQVYSGDTAIDHDLRISHVAIDRQHTTAEDPGSYFPLPELRRAAARGRIGSVSPRFHGLPTNRSHRATLEVDCPEIVARCKADAVDAAILAANCPVCHQSVSLAARMLEENGIATVVMGCAKDIVEYVGVPRLLFSDFPLGNAAGKPKDAQSQAFTLELALALLESAPGRAHDRAIAAGLEREPGLEARLQQHRPPLAGRDRAAARRIRQTEGRRQGIAQSACVSRYVLSGGSTCPPLCSRIITAQHPSAQAAPTHQPARTSVG